MKVFALVETGEAGRPLRHLLPQVESASGTEIVSVRSVAALAARIRKPQAHRALVLVSSTPKGLKAAAESVENLRVRIIPVVPGEGVTVVSGMIRTYMDAENQVRVRQTHHAATKAARSELAHAVQELHDPGSQRLSAKHVAELFGVPLLTLSEIVGRKYATVHKTPDARGLQDALKPFARIASAAGRLMQSRDDFRMWLNAPHPDLDGETPLAVIETGASQVVVDLLEDALMGHPA